MKAQKLKKSAHFLSLILHIGFIIAGVFSMLLFIGIICTVCIPLVAPEMLQSAWDVTLPTGQPLRFSQGVLFFVCCLGELICVCLSLYHAKRIFSCIGRGDSPFTAQIAAHIRRIAIYIASFGILSIIPVFRTGILFLLMCFFFALILFCISLIFDYGCELQQQIDETL